VTRNEGALVITGAARGIGACIARRAASANIPVAVLYRTSHDDAEGVAGGIVSAGGQAIAIAADVGDEADVNRAFDIVDKTFGGVSGLVNNAVLPGERNEFVDWQLDQVESVFRTNVFGAFLCARAAATRMSLRSGGRGGAIVSMSSAHAVNSAAPHGWIPFAASKAALETMSRGLAKELADDGVRVNVIRVGVIDTETRWTQGEDHVHNLIDNLVPMNRIGSADEVAAAALWLLSADASYVTGAALDVAGGL
jgi:NAD(P)-dependent dehydrogenase (short-subunit alcohol dehydrogenase family)